MNPYTGEAFRIREDLFGQASEPGDRVDMDDLRQKIAALGDEATKDEVLALRASGLVRVEEEVARRLQLGERERERRRRRRKAERRSRRANRS